MPPLIDNKYKPMCASQRLCQVSIHTALPHTEKDGRAQGKISLAAGGMYHELKDAPLDKNWALDQDIPQFGCIRRLAHRRGPNLLAKLKGLL